MHHSRVIIFWHSHLFTANSATHTVLPSTCRRIKNKLHCSSANFDFNLESRTLPLFLLNSPVVHRPSHFSPQVNSFLSKRSIRAISFSTSVAEFHQRHTALRTAPADFIFFVTLCFYNWGQTHAAHPVCWKPFVSQTSYISCGAF